MVCARCKMVVRDELARLGIETSSIDLGEVETKNEIPQKKIQQLGASLRQLGFEIIDDRKSRIIEKIKKAIIELVHYSEEAPSVQVSAFITQQLHYEYNYLSNLFSEVEGITIEKYFIAQKIEKVKELLMYDELSLSQIADRLGYSSVAYLSSQFKKQTGLTPTFFKNLKQKNRRAIDDL